MLRITQVAEYEVNSQEIPVENNRKGGRLICDPGRCYA